MDAVCCERVSAVLGGITGIFCGFPALLLERTPGNCRKQGGFELNSLKSEERTQLAQGLRVNDEDQRCKVALVNTTIKFLGQLFRKRGHVGFLSCRLVRSLAGRAVVLRIGDNPRCRAQERAAGVRDRTRSSLLQCHCSSVGQDRRARGSECQNGSGVRVPIGIIDPRQSTGRFDGNRAPITGKRPHAH